VVTPELADMTMISGIRTAFDGTGSATRWLRVLEEELPSTLDVSIWLKRFDVRLQGKAVDWLARTPKVAKILGEEGINCRDEEDKETVIALLKEEFPGETRNIKFDIDTVD